MKLPINKTIHNGQLLNFVGYIGCHRHEGQEHPHQWILLRKLRADFPLSIFVTTLGVSAPAGSLGGFHYFVHMFLLDLCSPMNEEHIGAQLLGSMVHRFTLSPVDGCKDKVAVFK